MRHPDRRVIEQRERGMRTTSTSLTRPTRRSVLAWAAAAVTARTLDGTAYAGRDEDATIDSLITDALRAWRVPGAAVAVVRGGEVVYLKGHGVRAVGGTDPVTPDTLFPLASCTKAFTATALAVLADEGKVGWDDHVRRHVPTFRLCDPLADADVRLRDLLCHRTGLKPHDLLWYRAPWGPEESVRRVGLLPLDRPFRTAFQYQSTMFTAAGLAVRAASGVPWDEFVRRRLLEPLGMGATVFTSTAAARTADRAAGHRPGRGGEPEPMPPFPMEVPDAAGTVHSTARDLARWLSFHLGDGTAGGTRVVSAENLAETHRPQMVIPIEGIDRELHPDTAQMCYGLGWVLHDYRGHPLHSHSGIIDGFRCHLTLAPKARLGVAVLSNLHQTRMNLALSNSLVDLLLGLPKKDWNGPLAAAVARHAAAEALKLRARQARRHHGTRPSRELAAYAGAYEHPAYGTARVALERGELGWRWHSFAGPLRHFHYDTFVLGEEFLGEPEVLFALDASGAVASMRVAGLLDVEFRRAGNGGR
jgi:CubicO group peptidase (beta-lactamase class C family)